MSCSCTTGAGSTILRGDGRISVGGSGTPTDPYIITEGDGSGTLQLEVRDSSTLNLSLFGSGTKSDPYIIRGDTSSAANLRSLSDVSPTPVVQQGAAPIWIGSSTGGHFEMRTIGVRYTTNATRGSGLYQGEVIRETDTQKRFEWDGSQWVDLSPAYVPPSALDPSVLQSAGSLDSGTDWNSLTTRSGAYRVSTYASNVNGPPGAYNYGLLTVLTSGLSVSQEYLEHGSGGSLWTRSKYNTSDWTTWRKIPYWAELQPTLDSLRTDLSAEVTNRNNAFGQANTRITQEINDRASAVTGLSNQINSVYSNYDGGRLDGRYYTKSQIDGGFSSRDDAIGSRVNNIYNATRMAAGNALVNNFTSNGNGGFSGYVDVSWPALALTSIVAVAQSLDSRGVIAQVGNLSNTGCRVMVVRPNNAATGIDWIAIGN